MVEAAELQIAQLSDWKCMESIG